ncbi:MAG: hypothetical protein V1875_07670 [Candidatus Altiarchaeota archaeon]
MAGVNVEVYTSKDHTNAVASSKTDQRGFYSVTVLPGEYYDVYLRLGDVNPNQRTTEPAEAGGLYTLNFNIASESSYNSSVVEKYGFVVVVAVAFLILAVILADQLFFRRARKPRLGDLERQRDQIKEMLELARVKYHHREMDEQSFREITRSQQEKLIEIESKIKGITGK